MTKKSMPIYEIIGIFREFLAFNLAKCQYKPSLFNDIKLHIICEFKLNISKNVDFISKQPKNQPYLRLRFLSNRGH